MRFRETLHLKIMMLCALATTGCGKNTFEAPQFSGSDSGSSNDGPEGANDGNSKRGKGESAEGANDGTGSGGPGTPSSPNTTPGPNDGIFVPKNPDDPNAPNESLKPCADEQNVLIIDLKSGWWEGDGANTFTEVIKENIFSACPPNLAFRVEYHHVIASTKIDRFWTEPHFEAYTQVWILSGSEADTEDIKVSDPRLRELIGELERGYANIFLGAGFGSIDHSNAVAAALIGTDIFTTPAKSGDTLEVKVDGSNIAVNSHFSPHQFGTGLFTGITTELTDAVTVGDKAAQSDTISGGVTVLAACGNGDCVGVTKIPQHNIVVDAGLQRFYGMYLAGEKTNIRQYLGNIVRALSK